MKRVWVSLIATAMAGIAAAQSAPTILYSPARDIKDQGIGIKAWGSGVISQTDEVAYEGTHSIRVSTRNFFQGGMLSFGNAVPLSSQFSGKENLLRLTFKMAEGSATGGGGGSFGGGSVKGPGGGGPAGPGGLGGPGGVGGPAGGRGGRPGAGGAGAPGGLPGGVGGPTGGGQRGGAGGFPGGLPGGVGGPAGGGQRGGAGGFPGGLPGGPGGFGGGASAAPTVLTTLRFIVSTSDGKRSEAYVPVNLNATGDNGWLSVSVPLQAIAGFDRTNKEVSGIGFAGDATATFYVGDVRIVNDSTPIRGEINQQNLNLGLGEEVTLSAYGFAGASILKYTWDFDSADGVQTDAEGQVVKRRFRKAGTYKITLTVTDFYGLKKPYTTTIQAVVNP